MDVAILTALEVERRAVCAAFGLTSKDRVKKNNRWYWCGKLPLHDGAAYEIVVAQLPKEGQVDAAVLATEVTRLWQPRAALLVGIAASTDPDKAKLGDVVVGRSVYFYEHGKVTEKGTSPQPEMIPADSDLLNHYVGLADWDGAVQAPRPDGTSGIPRVIPGVIASGDKVVAHEAARDAISAGQRKILALEMEGYGFSRAIWLSSDRIRHLVIRGISDYGTEHKNDDWHEYAAAAAAGYARHFLLEQPIKLEARPSGDDSESKLRSMQRQGRLPRLDLNWKSRNGIGPRQIALQLEVRNVGTCAVYGLRYSHGGMSVPSTLLQELSPKQSTSFRFHGDVNSKLGYLSETFHFRYSTEFGDELEDAWEVRFDPVAAGGNDGGVSLKHLGKKWIGEAGFLNN